MAYKKRYAKRITNKCRSCGSFRRKFGSTKTYKKKFVPKRSYKRRVK